MHMKLIDRTQMKERREFRRNASLSSYKWPPFQDMIWNYPEVYFQVFLPELPLLDSAGPATTFPVL